MWSRPTSVKCCAVRANAAADHSEVELMNPDNVQLTWTALKKSLFDSLMALTGRVFIVVRYAPDVEIGRRGFLPEERESGLILVFNSGMALTWEGDVLCGRLVFGTTPEDCRIPVTRIVALYNPDRQVQFLVPAEDGEVSAPSPDATKPGKKSDRTPEPSGSRQDNVVRVDFNRTRRGD